MWSTDPIVEASWRMRERCPLRHRTLVGGAQRLPVACWTLVVLAMIFGDLATPALSRGPAVAPRCAGIVWRSLRNGDPICPRTHSVLADISWIDLRLSVWNDHEVVGRGYESRFDAGYEVGRAGRVQITLTRVRRCSGATEIYSHIVVVAQPVAGWPRSRSAWSSTCRGAGNPAGA
jgi:hypothetical protein